MEIRVLIKGIHCGGCLNRIDSKLSDIGVDKFDMDLSNRTAVIYFELENTTQDDILEAIKSLGYMPIVQGANHA